LPARAEPAGLRARKKARTREAIRDHAFRLFREQGYGATTVEQIADAAEVSPSTFFRYFPTKEDVALTDDLDPLFIEAYRAQPREDGEIAAIRAAMRTVLEQTPADVVDRDRERQRIILGTPELRARALDQTLLAFRMLAEVVAGRVGRKPDDLAVRTFVGAVIGVGMTALADATHDPELDPMERFDAALGHLARGLEL
jgi:AcrR family transcriptional regulator